MVLLFDNLICGTHKAMLGSIHKMSVWANSQIECVSLFLMRSPYGRSVDRASVIDTDC